MRVSFSIAATRVYNSTFLTTIRFESEKYQMLCDLPVSPLFDENGVQATSGRVNFILLPVPPTTIAGSGGEVFMSRHKLDTEKSVHLVTDVELAIFLYIWRVMIVQYSAWVYCKITHNSIYQLMVLQQML